MPEATKPRRRSSRFDGRLARSLTFPPEMPEPTRDVWEAPRSEDLRSPKGTRKKRKRADPAPRSDKRVVVASYGTAELALQAERVLRDVGIPAEIVEDAGAQGTVTYEWHAWRRGQGGVELTVPAYLLPEAREALDLPPDDGENEGDDPGDAAEDPTPNDHEKKARDALFWAVMGFLICPLVGQVAAAHRLATLDARQLRPRYKTFRTFAVALLGIWFVVAVVAVQAVGDRPNVRLR